MRPSSRNNLGGMSISGSPELCFSLWNELPCSPLSGKKGRQEIQLKILGMIYTSLGKLLSIKLHGLPIHFTSEFSLSVVQISSKHMPSTCFVIPALYLVFVTFETMGYSWPISSLKCHPCTNEHGGPRVWEIQQHKPRPLVMLQVKLHSPLEAKIVE